MRLVEPLIDWMRPWPVRGKGALFNPVTPRHGLREVRVWGRYTMQLDLADVVERQMYMGCFGFAIASAVRALVRPGATVVDVGAHSGYFSLLAAHQVGPNGRVMALEPNPGTLTRLTANIQRNQPNPVVIRQTALSDAPGVLTLHVPPPDEHRAYNVTFVPVEGWQAVEVECSTLDTVVEEAQIESVDILKIDVEGAESRVFSGGERTLSSGIVRHIIAEVNGPRLVQAGSSPEALVRQLDSYGFAPAELHSHRARLAAPGSWDLDPNHEYDRLFVHRSSDRA